jgi:hypothetical protein
MKLIKLSTFVEIVFAEGSAPSLNTLRTQIRTGKIPGGTVQADHFYVDMDEYDRATGLHRNLVARKAELASHPLLAGLV